MSFNASEVLQMSLEFLGVVAIIAAGVKAIMYLASPIKKMRDTIDTHEKKLEQAKEYLKNDKEAIDTLKEAVRDSIRLNLALVNHEIDGNDIEYMKELRKEVQEKYIA